MHLDVAPPDVRIWRASPSPPRGGQQSLTSDFCNKIGPTRTSGNVRLESAIRPEPDIDQSQPANLNS